MMTILSYVEVFFSQWYVECFPISLFLHLFLLSLFCRKKQKKATLKPCLPFIPLMAFSAPSFDMKSPVKGILMLFYVPTPQPPFVFSFSSNEQVLLQTSPTFFLRLLSMNKPPNSFLDLTSGKDFLAKPLRSFLKEVGKSKKLEGEPFSLLDHLEVVQATVQAFLLPFEIPEYMCALAYIASDLVRMSHDQVCNKKIFFFFFFFFFCILSNWRPGCGHVPF